MERYCQIGRSTIYRLMREGLFPVPIRVGPRAVRWPEHELAGLAGPAPAGDRGDRPVRRHGPRLAVSPGSGPATDRPGFRSGSGFAIARESCLADASDALLNGPSSKANAAVDYLNTLYQPDDRLAIVAVGRHGPDPKVEQRVVTARAATRPGYQRFLRHLNATGHDIFVSMNPIRPNTQLPRKGRRARCPSAPARPGQETARTRSGRSSRT